jgi:hypothetical protein
VWRTTQCRLKVQSAALQVPLRQVSSRLPLLFVHDKQIIDDFAGDVTRAATAAWLERSL